MNFKSTFKKTKSLLSLGLLGLLIFTQASLSFASTNQACKNACITEIEDGLDGRTITPQEQSNCQNACNQDYDLESRKAYLACIEVDSHSNCFDILGEPLINSLPGLIKPDNLPGPNVDEDASGQDIQDYVRTKVLPKLASRLITITTIITIFMLVYSGITFVTALGNEEKIGDAKKIAIYAVIGLSIALSSYLIVSLINNLSL